MSRTHLAVAGAIGLASLTGGAQERRTDQQKPFRSGAHYVRVDAYPSRDGKPITGLTAKDFDLLEDGKVQTIDRVEFIDHPAWTPLGERRDPNSQRAGFELAQDPNYRVFVLYLDAFHVDFAGGHRTRVPIIDLLNRMMGPQDLFGVLTPVQTPKDLLLGQLTQTIEEQLAKYPHWGISDRMEPQPGELELEAYFPDGKRLVALRRLDKVYSDLEELIERLGALRDERKNIIYFSDVMPSPPPSFKDIANPSNMNGESTGNRGAPPPIGVGPTGKLTMGETNTNMDNRRALMEERARVTSIDFDIRFRSILQQARQNNVAFYTVRPGGLDMASSTLYRAISNLRVLAEETDGIAVADTNDLRTGMKRISADLSSHYVLGYYTTNTRWDGRTRKLTVKLKGTGQTVRARLEYRAPTEEEMAMLRESRAAAPSVPLAPSPAQNALSALSRISPSARLLAYGTVIGNDVTVVAEIVPAEIEAGRSKQGADVQVLLSAKGSNPVTVAARIEPGTRSAIVRVPVGEQPGPWQAVVRMTAQDSSDSDTISIARATGPLLGRPLAYRAASAAASAYRPLGTFQFRRTERVRVEWPALQPIESHSARLLDRTGKPLAVPVPTTSKDAGGTTLIAADLNFAPLSIGDYLIEVTAKAGDKTEQQVIGVRVSMAR